MYLSPLWIEAHHAQEICQHGYNYLSLFQRLAQKAHDDGRMLFLYNAKVHMMCHLLRNLGWEAEVSMTRRALNQMMFGCQMDEDLIGKAARVSRHVSSKLEYTTRRTLQRWLIASYTAWRAAGMVKRCNH